MQKFILFSIWLTVAVARPDRFGSVSAGKLSGRIVGGSDARIEDFPYQLSLRILRKHNCGASVISEKWALSAAHCTYPKLGIKNYTLWGGSSHRFEGGTVFEIERIENHHSYNEQTINFDVCVLKTKFAMTRRHITPVPLVSANKDFMPGTLSIVSGWGLTRVPGSLAEVLKMINVPLMSQAECRRYWGTMLTDDMLCAKKLGIDACTSDSGGPLVVNGLQVGIVSWGDPRCDGSLPGVYARINHPRIRGWIKTITDV